MAHIHDLQNLVSDGVESTEFKLIRSRKDVDDETITFKPEMAHQIFGENENIFGYRDLKITMMYTAGPLYVHINMNYSQNIDKISLDGMKADDVIGIITSKLPIGSFYTNMDDFLKTIDKGKDFQPFGEKLQEYMVEDKFGKKRHFEFYKCEVTTKNFPEYFERLQSFVLWFVDAASYIDVDDTQWIFFVCYEKYKNLDGNYQYASVGYTTVYLYYAYPEHVRPRISQMLILPPFQKIGIGTKFFETIYDFFRGDTNVIDITVEDPSDDFQRIRNYIDAKLCINLPSFNEKIIKKGFNKEMIKEAREKFKINPRQCRKIYEILRLYHTNIHKEEDYKPLRLDIKKRLNLIYHKQLSDIIRMNKAGVDTQWLIATMPTMEERLEQLENEYREVETEYKKIVEKIK